MKSKRILLTFLLIMPLSLLTTSAQVQTPPTIASSQMPALAPPQMSFAALIKKSIVYIRTDCLIDNKILSYSSTGFFLYEGDDRLGKDRGFVYLVTNGHAVQPGIEHGTPCRVANYSFRVNIKSAVAGGLPEAVDFPLGANVSWVFPTDPSIDLALFLVSINQEKVDFEPISSKLLATNEEIKRNGIGEGDSVFFSGLFVQMPGLLRLEPIVRQGTIAMMPTEPIVTTLGKPGELYLADVHVFGGNSGSPMFVNLGGMRQGSLMIGSSYLLLGIVSGYEFETTDFNLQAATTYSGTIGANSGVTSVVPANELYVLLHAPARQAERDEKVKLSLSK